MCGGGKECVMTENEAYNTNCKSQLPRKWITKESVQYNVQHFVCLCKAHVNSPQHHPLAADADSQYPICAKTKTILKIKSSFLMLWACKNINPKTKGRRRPVSSSRRHNRGTSRSRNVRCIICIMSLAVPFQESFCRCQSRCLFWKSQRFIESNALLLFWC